VGGVRDHGRFAPVLISPGHKDLSKTFLQTSGQPAPVVRALAYVQDVETLTSPMSGSRTVLDLTSAPNCPIQAMHACRRRSRLAPGHAVVGPLIRLWAG
jgi:hypothetical protein